MDCIDGSQRGNPSIVDSLVNGTRNYFIICTALAEHHSDTYLVITITRSLNCTCGP
jgi:hypothetical protein